MNKITFANGGQPAINDTNLNLMQTNIENAINALNTKLDGSVLYENSEGISEGDIVLSESIANYKRLVFYSNTGQWLGDTLTTATEIVLQQNDQGQSNTMLRIARLNVVNNTKLSFFSNKNAYYDGSGWARSNSILILGKIIGYNY